MPAETISILDGSTFIVSNGRGDIVATPNKPQGFFYRDTRFLSHWCLTFDGASLDVLSTENEQYFSSQFFLVPAGGTVYDNPTVSVIRWRFVRDGFHEDLKVMNHGHEPLRVEIRLHAEADFADIFDVKDTLPKQGTLHHHVSDESLTFEYRRNNFVRRVDIVSAQPATMTHRGLSFALNIPAGGEWQNCIEVRPHGSGFGSIEEGHSKFRRPKPKMGRSLDQWRDDAPRLDTDWDVLRHVYDRTVVDLAALRFYSDVVPDASVPAAGLPWFMSLFGRDSLITSYQALPFFPELAQTTLRVLAARQASAVDDFRDAEPGKILHEMRYGEAVAFGEYPHSPYYGAADTTPLFLVLLDEYERWTGDQELIRQLEPNARAAVAWMQSYGDLDGDGYIEYERRNTDRGLVNQCWKDSGDSIVFADGSPSSTPRATCEIQGYAYDARRRAARLARTVWNDSSLAAQLDREADELRAQFRRDFWVTDGRFYALALDGNKRPVDSLTSNIGHLLWSGILEADHAADVARHLLEAPLFSGWGVRTMATTEAAYNPLGYHTGTVWPHDNSIIAAGLRRYGYLEAAGRVAEAVIASAGYFQHRLPEAFAGYDRLLTNTPVPYPTASSPQAWASAAPLLLIRVLLGLEPAGRDTTGPTPLPDGVTRLDITPRPLRERKTR